MRSPLDKINVFQNNFGVSIEYTLDPEENISAFANGMMTYNNIKGILGYIYEANNGECQLRFNQPNGIQLSLLLGQTLKKQLLLGILSGIADTLHQAEEYMLDEGGFILDPQLIFVNTATLNVDLVYIPTGINYDCPYWIFVKTLMYSGIVNTDEDTTYVQQIVNFINSNQPVAREKLADHIKTLADSTKASPVVNKVPVIQPVNAPFQPHVPVQQPSAPAAPVSRAANIPVDTHTEEQKNKKGGLFSGLIGKKKSEKSDKSAKNENSAKGFEGEFGFNIPGQKPVADKNVVQNPTPQPSATANNAKAVPLVQNQQAVYATAGMAAPTVEEPCEDFDGKTVLLGMDGNSFGSSEQKFFLERKNGEKIYINKSMFFIGKADKSDIQNDYIIRNGAVSRNHAYFQLVAGGVTVTDNNSSNGTFINDEKIPSLVQRELKNGDIVRLADEIFVFKVQ